MSLKENINNVLKGKKSIIDLCAGPGTYGAHKDGYTVAVEIDNQYFNKLQAGYDEVHIEDVRNIPTMSMGEFGVCMWIDGIEHLEEDDAVSLLEYMETCSKEMLVFTPNEFVPNDYGVEFQKHRSVFPRDFWLSRGYKILFEEFNPEANITNILYHKVVTN